MVKLSSSSWEAGPLYPPRPALTKVLVNDEADIVFAVLLGLLGVLL